MFEISPTGQKRRFHYRRIKKPITNETGTVQTDSESEEEREIQTENGSERESESERESDERIEDDRMDEDSYSEYEQDVDENETMVREIVRELEIEYM